MLQPARQCYLDRLHCLDLRLCQLTGSDVLNKQICKMAGLSPDAMMQLSFQLANDLVHSRPAATYESCSTAAFKHGRTETIRSASPNTRRFVELFRTSTNWAEGKSNDELFTALEAVSKSHVTLIKEAAMGQD
ncbi:unnamed protein product [Protopolystoma xenopodis]|uniref:Choline/carnitine acyltransferase domain-containing protein n=1 Tax=Protopolystoma xenopodis TaxID=117903 RepID=A0A448WRW6_9PLAT|nr:unnamed protein product [Protopolystoma xenopodis]